MKKAWIIVSKDTNTNLTRTPIEGSREQAEAYWNLTFDTDRTKLIEQPTLDLDKLTFESGFDDINCYFGMQLQFTVEHDHGMFWLMDNELGDRIEEADIDHLKQFPNFLPLVICDTCHGSGYYTTIECGKPASEGCCGGCEVAHECDDCDKVKFPIE